jgi:diguanylate cyclase (GGDEF)-like protein
LDEAPSRTLHLVPAAPEAFCDPAVRRTLEAIPIPALAVAFDGTILSVNAAGHESGYFEHLGLVGRALTEALDDVGARAVSDALSALAAGRVDSAEVAAGMHTALGHPITVTLTVAVVRDEADMHSCAVVLVRDESDHRRDEAELRHRASHDGLTELPNRAAFLDRLVQALARDRRRGSWSALLFIDLDGFKAVNDTLGHSAGDELLFSAAGRVRRVMRPEDTLARYGGDEFTALCEDLHGAKEAHVIAQRVLDGFEAPFLLSTGITSLSASIGVAVVASGSRDAASVITAADAAMYTSKQSGGGRYTVHDLKPAGASIEARRVHPSTRLRSTDHLPAT